MKKAILTVIAVAVLTGCASQNSMPETAGNDAAIHLGMTKEQVLKALGGHKPKSISESPRGEVWHYDNRELAMIPFNFGFRPEFKSYTFDNNGILIDFVTNKPTK